MTKQIDLIGATTNFGQPKPGVVLGPDALRIAGIVQVLEAIGHDVSDLGNVYGKYQTQFVKDNVQVKNGLKNYDEVKDYSEALAKVTDASVQNGRFPLVIGGDHSLALGSITGIAKHYDNLGVIWFDAHGDLNTSETSPSGNIHGMILAELLGVGDKGLIDTYNEGPSLKTENVVLIGLRDLDDGEKELIKKRNILAFTMSDVRALGLVEILDRTMKHLAHCDGLHLSFDVDSLDPSEMIGTGTKVPGGMFIAEVIMFMERLSETGLLTSVDLVEVNPLLDTFNQTAENAVLMTEYIFGKRKL
ncbi:arginase [Phocicoccus pinnipedialis]|uniref:Arginase n=1 Tax=Phocicoccus pinnipedialis TaxID=110845 RepID=A0A6V7QZR6_9BACL|nr:arginase [Jeotgalicoccus pinnipedialis]MBP1938701.1 arginase [Jeotgalicoccus pinnipedialis]CAD2070476.1 Arginase [Jeotgalicoccus pinnipedialis]